MDVIRITLRSDLCAGNGESRGNAVDIDIVLTADGLPRIPARRLKGCLRAAAEELAPWAMKPLRTRRSCSVTKQAAKAACGWGTPPCHRRPHLPPG